MALTILNNLSAMSAENSLSATQANLQNTLTQLSTGLRINSGSDDAAGLSIANGMQANIAALTQSAQNATNGIGMLQTADGALSQVTTLLSRAVTLATEAANGGLSTGSQQPVCGARHRVSVDSLGDQSDRSDDRLQRTERLRFHDAELIYLDAGYAGDDHGADCRLEDRHQRFLDGWHVRFHGHGLIHGLRICRPPSAAAVTAGTLSSWHNCDAVGAGQLVIATSTSGASLNVTTNDAVLGPMQNSTTGANNSITFISDGTQTGAANTQIQTVINQLSATTLGLASSDLQNDTNAAAALTAINDAISTVSAQRGQIGASVNRLQSASNVITAQVQNLTSASNGIMNADVGKTVSNMTQYNILQSTGMAALQQANQAQQAVLKLLQ